MVVALVLYEEAKFYKIITWIIPIILAGAFYFTASYLYILNVGFEVSLITIINLIFSLLYLGVGYLLLKLITIKQK